VPVVHAVFVAAAQPGQHLHPPSGIPDFHVLDRQPYLNVLTDQPAGHRVAVAADVDEAAAIHPQPQPLARLQPPCRQRPQHRQLLRQPHLSPRVELRQQRPQERDVGLPVGEVAAAPQLQCLVQRFLEAPVPLLDVAILVGVGRLDLLPDQSVMGQQRLVTPGELLGIRQVVHRRTEPVGAVPLGHAP
jgi:hypothetical protein